MLLLTPPNPVSSSDGRVYAATGLFGINVGGIPGTESEFAFTTFCILLLGLAAVQVWFFKRKKWT